MRRCITLENKIKDALSFIVKSDSKKIKIIVAMGLIAIILIAFSSMFQSKDSKSDIVENDSFDYSSYSEETERKLTNIISSIDGVGECEVMITFEYTGENIYAKDSEAKSDDTSQSNSDQYVLYDSQNGEKALLIKEKYPTVQGVSIVCTGGDNTQVREAIINTVTSLFDISTNRVSVSKIKKKSLFLPKSKLKNEKQEIRVLRLAAFCFFSV